MRIALAMALMPIVLAGEAVAPAPVSALTAPDAAAALKRWFPADCAVQPAPSPRITVAIDCQSRQAPQAPPLRIVAAVLTDSELGIQANAQRSTAAEPKPGPGKRYVDRVLRRRIGTAERTPAGRLGFYGAHPGLNHSSLSFIVIDPSTRASLQLLYTYAAPPPGTEVDQKATAKSMDQVYDQLKRAAFVLERHHWQ